MKYLNRGFITLIALYLLTNCLCFCNYNVKEPSKIEHTYYISGKDSILVHTDGHWGCSQIKGATHGYWRNDTFVVVFTNSMKKDTVWVHDGINSQININNSNGNIITQ